jgi:hypothetical protein
LCGNTTKKLYKTGQPQPGFLICHCSGVLEKALPNVNTSSVEIYDNGLMAKKVELRKDAAERMKERGDIHIKTMDERETVIKKHDTQD